MLNLVVTWKLKGRGTLPRGEVLIAANTGSGVLGRCCAVLWGGFPAPLAESTLPGGDRDSKPFTSHFRPFFGAKLRQNLEH